MQVYKYFCQTCWSIWSLPQAAALTHHFPACGECCLVGSSSPDPGDNIGRGPGAALPQGGFAWGALEDTPRSDLILAVGAQRRWGQAADEGWVEASSGVEAAGWLCGGASGRHGADRLFPWPAIHGRRLQLNCQHGKTVSVLKSKLQRRSLYLMLQTP